MNEGARAPRVTLGTLARRSLWFHRRAHAGVLLGAALGAAILVGALAVGDSVRGSLRGMALARLGAVQLALLGQGRFFREALAGELAGALRAPVAPVLLLRGTALSDSGGGAGHVQVVGVSEPFWRLGGARPPLGGAEEAVVINERLARKLGVGAGDELLLRVEKPSRLSRDAPLATIEDAAVPVRLPVRAVATEREFGRFSLEAGQLPPLTVFVPLARLQRDVALPGRVNALLIGPREGGALAAAEATAALERHWKLADAGLEVRALPGRGVLELRTDRVFLDPPVGQAALEAAPGARGVLTYFVNGLDSGGRSTPYSSVAALQGGPVPPDMTDDEILINRWLAEDLGARAGDELRLTYFVVGPMRRLIERSRAFRIRAVLPLEGAAADRELMPAIPGLTDSENCRDWEPGIPIELGRIRAKDEQYWDAYRGTPKAFVTLGAGQRMWNNRFGDLTAVRYPAHGLSPEALEDRLRSRLTAASLGFLVVPAREQALAAASPAMDFGALFLGFSVFLIVAALLLTALLFAFGVEQRAEEIGVLLALGFPPRRVRWLLLLEGGALALLASLIGAGVGLLYTRAVIAALSTVWRGAVAGAELQFHAELRTLAVGALAGFVTATLAIALVVRRQARVPARELLAAGADAESRLLGPAPAGRAPGARTAAVSGLAALALIAAALGGEGEQGAAIFFGAGALLLLGGIAACRALLSGLQSRAREGELTLGGLGLRNSVRRQGRSLATVALLACGSFLVIAVGANRHDPGEGAERRSAGTGGFAFYGETALPVYHDLNGEEGREVFGLDAAEMAGVRIVPLRLRPGDEASCLNLNRAQAPRLLGVGPRALAERGAFTFARTLRPVSSPWDLLDGREADGAVPAVGDVNTVVWSLGKSLGDTLAYVDDRGRVFQLRIVGILANSVLQGSLLLSERAFLERFPTQEGYQVFLVDAPRGAPEAAPALARGLEDVGLELTPAAERLAEFQTVESTYLSVFAVLGGLGLLLGSLGLGIVVLRNVLERRGELALLRAVGFGTRPLRWLVFSEHVLLLALGLAVGVVAALIAVLPALRAPGAGVPYLSLAVTLGAVFLSGFLWTWGATALALRGPLLAALRNE